MIDDAWLSLVERCVRDAEVAGSNPVASTYYSHLKEVAFLVPATGSGPNFGRRGPWRSGGPPFRADRSGAQTAGSNPVASTYYSHLFEVAFLVPATGAQTAGGPGDLRLVVKCDTEKAILWCII